MPFNEERVSWPQSGHTCWQSARQTTVKYYGSIFGEPNRLAHTLTAVASQIWRSFYRVTGGAVHCRRGVGGALRGLMAAGRPRPRARREVWGVLAPRGGRVLAFRCGAPFPRGGCAAPPTASGRFKVCACTPAGGPRVGGAAGPRSWVGPPPAHYPCFCGPPPARVPAPAPAPRPPRGVACARGAPPPRARWLPRALGRGRSSRSCAPPGARCAAVGRGGPPGARGGRCGAGGGRAFFSPAPLRPRPCRHRARSEWVGGFSVLVRLCRRGGGR